MSVTSESTYQAHVMAFASNSDETTIIFLITYIEQLIEVEAVLSSHSDVRTNIIEFAKEP